MSNKQSTHWSVLKVGLVVGILSLWILLELNIERTDLTLFVPHTGSDSHLNRDALIHKGFLVNTNGCRIPDLDPMDPSIRKFIVNEEPINCSEKYGPPLVESNLTSVFINEAVLWYYNVSDINELRCCYKPFWRVQAKKTISGDYPSNVDVQVKFAAQCTTFNDAAVINEEFVKIECYSNGSLLYTDYHSFPLLRNITNKIKINESNKDTVSVLVFGVDAVSRLNLYRTMPETLKFLKNSLNAVEMLGYNKVDDNTFVNLVPVLTGLFVNEIQKSCWPKTESVFDDCNFVWKNYSAAGYKTVFGEDASWMGIFNYIKKGFHIQPTDYYMRIFNNVAENHIGFEKRLNANLCVGPRKNLETLLSYAYKFLYSMKDILSFGLFWGSSLTHDYLNLPKYGDSDHKDFLERLYNEGIFNRTILIFMSDHGIRWGGIRQTYQGYLEERLPFLFISYPEWFRIKYTTAVSNLKKNVHKLTTPFDLHEVLLDLVNLTQLDKDVIKGRAEELLKAKTIPRGISLFLPIPSNRTCSDAGIAENWCTCHQSSKVDTKRSDVQHAASHLVEHINSLLKNHSECAKLKLSKVISAREEKSVSHNMFKTSDVGMKDISITIETTPGKALFEATVRYNGNANKYTIVGRTSRINLYGEQSRCISDYALRLYCYCDKR